MQIPAKSKFDKLKNRLFYRLALSHKHTKRFLIPHDGNAHHPHALRPMALKIYSLSIISVKLFVTGFLFLTYPSAGHFAAITQTEMLNLTNASRAEASISPLTLNTTLNQAAMLKAKDMIAKDYFAHTSPDGTKPWEFLRQAGYSYSSAGENLAMDFTEASSVHTAFMNSPSHKKNIMNEKYTEMGIAVMEGQLQGHQTTLLVVFFGTPYEQTVAPAPAPTPTPVATAPTNTNVAKPVVNTNTAPTNTNVAKPVVKPTNATAAQPQYFQAKLSDQSAKDLAIKPLERIQFWVEFKNTGTITWTNSGEYFVAMNVTNPAGRHSAFEDETWKSYYRPATLQQAEVKPGQSGKFEFTLKAPSEAGSYEESYGLVAEGKAWISGGTIELPIVVVAPPEKGTETQTQVIETPLTNSNTNTDTTANANTGAAVLTNENTNSGAPEEKPLAARTDNTPIVKSAAIENEPPGFIGKLIDYSQQFYLVFLIFIVIVLLTNIVVEIRIQHPHVIAQSLLVIIITTAAIILHPHFLERVPEMLKII
ncbi:MAG: CAP domain-containing protein [Patescibacteria group bacterium]